MGRSVQACTSVTLPISPDQTISATWRVPSLEYPWLPIWVATLYLLAASINLRASQIVRVSGFCTHTCLPRSIAHMAAVACMKSGMVTINASMPFSLSSILRKSLYLGTFSYWLNLRAACFSSTSHSATMFSDAQLVRSLAAWPPAPIEAMFSFSLGDLYPSLASILRKSLYLGSFSFWLNLRAACFSSTSHSATMFSDAQLVRSLAAWPP